MNNVFVVAKFNKPLIFVFLFISVCFFGVCVATLGSIFHYGGDRYSPEVGITMFLIGFATASIFLMLSGWHTYSVLKNGAAIYIDGTILHYYSAGRESVDINDIQAVSAPLLGTPFGSKLKIILKSGKIIQIQTAIMVEDGRTIYDRLVLAAKSGEASLG